MKLFDFGGIIPETDGYAIVDLEKVEGIYVDNVTATKAWNTNDGNWYESTTYYRVIIQTERNKIVAGLFGSARKDAQRQLVKAVALAQKLGNVLSQQLKNSNPTK